MLGERTESLSNGIGGTSETGVSIADPSGSFGRSGTTIWAAKGQPRLRRARTKITYEYFAGASGHAASHHLLTAVKLAGLAHAPQTLRPGSGLITWS